MTIQKCWPKAVSGWTATAGINTELAFNERQAVEDAYPNAEETYDERGKITALKTRSWGSWSSGRKVFISSRAACLWKSMLHRQCCQRGAASTSLILT